MIFCFPFGGFHVFYCLLSQIPALADAGFRVIALEMKGYGESTAPPGEQSPSFPMGPGCSHEHPKVFPTPLLWIRGSEHGVCCCLPPAGWCWAQASFTLGRQRGCCDPFR